MLTKALWEKNANVSSGFLFLGLSLFRFISSSYLLEEVSLRGKG